MREFLINSAYFGLLISIAAYGIGYWLNRKTKSSFLNPLMIASVLVIGVLLLLDLDYEIYNRSAKYLSYLLTPATVCLAVPLYRQIKLLKENIGTIFISIFSGVLSSLVCVWGCSVIFGLSHEQYVTMLPKSITTAIGMSVAEELGGIPSIAVVSIILTGIVGNVIAVGICRILKLRHPLAKGLAIGTGSHAIGTAKAMEMGEIEGAAGSLAIVIAGIMTVILAPIFAGFY